MCEGKTQSLKTGEYHFWGISVLVTSREVFRPIARAKILMDYNLVI